jgi:hypothetical protein
MEVLPAPEGAVITIIFWYSFFTLNIKYGILNLAYRQAGIEYFLYAGS